MAGSVVLHDIGNAATGSESKRSSRFRLLPLAFPTRSDQLARTRKSAATCTVSLETASSCITNIIPFPDAPISMDSEPDIDFRPYKSRRCSEDSASAGSLAGDRQANCQIEPRRRRVASHRHSLLAPAAYTCHNSPALRPRSASFSHSRKLSARESADLRFMALVRRSVLAMTDCGDFMDVDDPSGDLLRHQDNVLCSRIEEKLLQRGYRDLYLEGEPIRTSVLLSADDGILSEPYIASAHRRTLTKSQLVAALILRYKTRSSSRQRGRAEVASSPLARQD